MSRKLAQRAAELCPDLAGADIVEQWAGIRPRAAGRDPVVGALPGAPRLVVASGGFKITLGIAHKMADAALNIVTGASCSLPSSFAVAAHIARTV